MSDDGKSRLIFALDIPTLDQATGWVERLRHQVGLFKVGLELFSAAGPAAVEAISRHGSGIFLDLKLHDIPTTVERATRAVSALGVHLLSVHAQGGREMLEAAARGAGPELCVLAITRLTSQAAGVDEVVALALDAQAAGCGGVVCAGSEAAAVRKALGADLLIVCPGIRAAGAAPGDQARIVTAGDAIRAGADRVVVGRPIRDAEDPVQAASALALEISRALAD